MDSKMFLNFLKTLPQVKVESEISGSLMFIRITDTRRNIKRIYKADLDILKEVYSEDLIGAIYEECAEEFCTEVYNA